MAPTTRTTRSSTKNMSPTGARAEKPNQSKTQHKTEQPPARIKTFAVKKQCPTSSKLPTRLDHIILEDVNDSKIFLAMCYQPSVDPTRIRTLEIHLDATKVDEYADYRLARALNELHPDTNGTNPHKLNAVKIVVKGNVLFTRYSYCLASPAMSQDANDGLRKLVTNGLAEQDKIRLKYKVYATEKIVARALLGIRGVRQVVVVEEKGKMEGRFAETIKATLVQPPETNISEQDGTSIPNSRGRLYGGGLFSSEAYQFGRTKAFPRHLPPVSEEGPQLPTTPRPSTRAIKRKPEFSADSTPSTVPTCNKRKRNEEELGMESMVRIRAQQQDVEGGGLSKLWIGAEEYDLPLVLTGKGGTVEMGWKVR